MQRPAQDVGHVGEVAPGPLVPGRLYRVGRPVLGESELRGAEIVGAAVCREEPQRSGGESELLVGSCRLPDGAQ